MSTTRVHLERGLDRIERIADESHTAVAYTERALGETAQRVRDIGARSADALLTAARFRVLALDRLPEQRCATTIARCRQ